VLQDISKRRLVDEAANALRRLIVEARIKPGERLFQEKLAEMLGISRTPIREALQLLEREGLVSSLGRQGVVVTQLSSKDVEETYDVREVLDGLAARLAADRISDTELVDLRKPLDKMDSCAEKGDRRRWLEANQLFHDIIVQVAQNERLVQALAAVRTSLDLFAPFVWAQRHRRDLSNREHQEIYEALASRNAREAERLARAHAQVVKEAVLDALKEQPVRADKKEIASGR